VKQISTLLDSLKSTLSFKEQIIASFLLLIPLVNFTIGSLWLMIGLNVSAAIFPFSFLIAIALCYTLFKKKATLNAFILNLFYGFALFLICIFTCRWFYDVSFDGQWYHQDAIILLSQGWNPFYDAPLLIEQTSGACAPYLNHYPKGSWIISAYLYRFLNNIQMAKAYNLLFIMSTFLYCIYYLKKWLKLPFLTCILCSFLLSFSTISFGQSLSFYVDGQIASLLLLVIFLLIDYLDSKLHFSKLVLLALLVFYIVNLKFTALIYVVLFSFTAFIYLIIKNKALLYRFVGQQSLVFFLAVFVFGFPTYVTNTIEKSHPFYPIMGPDNEGQRIAEIPYPKNFFNKNRFEKYYLSSFAIPEWTSPKLKGSQPKKLFNKEGTLYSFKYFRNPQPPMPLSPSGPIHAELLIFLIPLILVFFFKKQKTETYVILGGLLFSILIQPELWNYRYTPQIWFFYLFFILFGLIHFNKWIKYYASFVAVIAFINVGITHKQYLSYNREKTNVFNSEIEKMKNKKVCIKKGWMRSFEYRLKEKDIDYHFCEDEKDFESFEGGDFSNWKYKTDSP